MKHFTISELLKSDTALKNKLWNGAPKEAEENLRALVDEVLDPLREAYADKSVWEEKAKDLSGRFIKNFEKFTTNAAGKALVAAGPKL